MEGPGFDLGDNNYTGYSVNIVKDVTYLVKKQFVNETYDSCKNVQFPALSGTVMGSIY